MSIVQDYSMLDKNRQAKMRQDCEVGSMAKGRTLTRNSSRGHSHGFLNIPISDKPVFKRCLTQMSMQTLTPQSSMRRINHFQLGRNSNRSPSVNLSANSRSASNTRRQNSRMKNRFDDVETKSQSPTRITLDFPAFVTFLIKLAPMVLP